MSAKTPLLANGQQQRQNQEDEKIKRVQGQIHDTQKVVQDNIHHAIQRGQQLNDLDDKSIQLENESVRFKERSKAVKKNMCFNRYRQMAILILVGLGVVALISLLIYFAARK